MSPPSQRVRGTMTLFSHLDCPRSHAIRFVLALKGLPHDLVFVDPERPPKDLLAAVPAATLPTLMEREVVLYEPRIIAEYLDERFPHPPLLPNDPLGRARGRLTFHRIEQEWLAPLDQIRADNLAAAARARSELRDALREADSVFQASKFFLSPDIGLADCLLLPILWRLPSAGIKWRDLGPAIDAYAQRLFNTPLFQRTLSEAERKLVES